MAATDQYSGSSGAPPALFAQLLADQPGVCRVGIELSPALRAALCAAFTKR